MGAEIPADGISGAGQIQSLSSGQLEFTQRLLMQTNDEPQSLSKIQVSQQPGTGVGVAVGAGVLVAVGAGVEVGVLVGNGQVQSSSSGQEGLAHLSPIQSFCEGQSFSTIHVSQHPGIGVGVALGVMVEVGVGLDVPVGVGVELGVGVTVGVIEPVGVGAGVVLIFGWSVKVI